MFRDWFNGLGVPHVVLTEIGLLHLEVFAKDAYAAGHKAGRGVKPAPSRREIEMPQQFRDLLKSGILGEVSGDGETISFEVPTVPSMLIRISGESLTFEVDGGLLVQFRDPQLAYGWLVGYIFAKKT